MKKILLSLGTFTALILVAALVVYNLPAGQDALFRAAAKTVMTQPTQPIEGLRVVVCGSASPLGNDPNRAQACIAVLTPDHFFLFDLGARSPIRIAQARLPLNRVDGVFFTHYHSDHIAALPDINLASWVQGRRQSLQVYGPAGIKRIVNGFNEAYALDRSYRTAHHGEELLPSTAGPMTANAFIPNGVVWADNKLTITAFPVEHPPIEPAVGYRIDYAGRSVVISGDTNAADSLFAAAANADLLLHDALSMTLLGPMIETADELKIPQMPTIMRDVIDYHADSTSLHKRAALAGIKQLAFYHMVPVPANGLAEKMFLRGLPDEIILVDDLHTFDLPDNSSQIIINAP